MHHPRVLFLTPCAFNHVTGGGITFTNLFQGWPKDRLATVHDDGVPVSRDVCEKYYRLGRDEVRPAFPFNLRRPRLDPADSGPAAAAAIPAPPPSRLRLLGRRLYARIIGTAGIPETGILSPALERWIRDFRPDVIYTILGRLAYIDLVLAVQDRFGLPLAIHLMDDGVTDPLRKGFYAGRIRREYAAGFARVLPKTTLRLGICRKMCVAYRERYGRDFRPFQNTVDVDRWAQYAKNDLSVAETPTVVYMGSIYAFAQLQSIIDFCEVVKALYAAGTRIRFDIYTPLKLFSGEVAGLPDSRSVFLHDTITDDSEYFRVLGRADALFLPVNFDSLSVHFIRYSMPTKVPSYLCSGTPILVYGPAETAQVEYALEDGWAKVVDRRDPDALRRGLLEILGDPGLRARVSAAALTKARENHDSRKVRLEFQACLGGLAPAGAPVRT